MSFRQTVAEWCQFSDERLVTVDNVTDFDINLVQAGVVFAFAEWSGVAPVLLKRYSKLMDGLEPRSVKLYVVNHDSLSPDKMQRLFGELLHGYAETIFVRNGKAIGRLTGTVRNPESNFQRTFCYVFGDK